jgi:EAL and modified HD-GYP domain-containing signal transduction protein
MERVLVSRQPIFRADMNEIGYELLFSDDETDTSLSSDGTQTTSNILANTFMDIGLDQVVGNRFAFINFDRNFILSNYCDSLPQERVVLELPKTVEPDTEIIKKLERLRAAGYRIALDGSLCTKSLEILRLAHFAKIDLGENDWQTTEKSVKTIFNKFPPIRLIAEGVETREQFVACKDIGFHCFQGQFFCRPQFVRGRRLPVSRLAAVRLMTKLNDSETDLKELESTISQDVALTYKLLRYINSATFSLRTPVTSVGHALVLMGEQRIRTWASLILLSSFDDKSRDLMITATARARMGKNLAVALGLPNPDRMFFTGLLSVLDGLLDQPMDAILPSLPLDREITDALLSQSGSLGAILHCVLEYERRNWSGAESAAQLPVGSIREAYQESLAWSLNTFHSVSASQLQPTH